MWFFHFRVVFGGDFEGLFGGVSIFLFFFTDFGDATLILKNGYRFLVLGVFFARLKSFGYVSMVFT